MPNGTKQEHLGCLKLKSNGSDGTTADVSNSAPTHYIYIGNQQGVGNLSLDEELSGLRSLLSALRERRASIGMFPKDGSVNPATAREITNLENEILVLERFVSRREGGLDA
ncbi:MAG: hypothetical protein EXQ88_00905 [Alphaproteobacteria bacterium]|nr:hypothetical protein [Alphaproteobacteria bacterium]